MKKFIVAAAAAALLPMATPVMAKDICVGTFFGQFYFKGVGAIKPKAILPLRGIFIQGGDIPVYGTLSVDVGGNIRYVISVPAPQNGWHFTLDISATDKTLAGSGVAVQYDNAGGFTTNNSVTLTAVDCKTVVRP